MKKIFQNKLLVLFVVIIGIGSIIAFNKSLIQEQLTAKAQTQLSNQTYPDIPPAGNANSWAYWSVESQVQNQLDRYNIDMSSFCSPSGSAETNTDCFIYREHATVIMYDAAKLLADSSCTIPYDDLVGSPWYCIIDTVKKAGILNGVTMYGQNFHPYEFINHQDAVRMVQNATGQAVSYPPNYTPSAANSTKITRTQMAAQVAWNFNNSITMQVKGNIDIPNHEQLNGAVVRLFKADGSPVLGADNQAVQGTITVTNNVALYELTWAHPIKTAYSDDIGKTLKIKIDKPGFDAVTYFFTVSSVVNQFDLVYQNLIPCDFNFKQYIGPVAGKDFRNLACSAH